ncbi:MAG: hypothetical protein AB1454_06680 [Candidatus Auribacterota bacterium]
MRTDQSRGCARSLKFAVIFYPMISILMLYVLIINSWLCDDAYITFRTVDNFVNGYGLRWNVVERVQTYTHPLWLFLLSFFYYFTREAFYTTHILSLVFSICTLFFYIKKIANNLFVSILGIIILLFSNSFIEFSSSGLENPLTHLLAALYFVVYLDKRCCPKKLFFLSLLSSLALLNRLDNLILFLPPLVLLFLRNRSKKALLFVLLGFLPILTWELFSLVYYGFLIPNTAYAKLCAGIPSYEMHDKGVFYLLNSIQRDPVTLPVIFCSIVVPFLTKRRHLYVCSISVLLYLMYIVKIGGCFMSGRFLSPLVFFAVTILTSESYEKVLLKRILACLWILLILTAVLSKMNPLVKIPKYGFREHSISFEDSHGVGDEQLFYYKSTGLLHLQRTLDKNLFNELPPVSVKTCVGMIGYYAGPAKYIIDVHALTDPFLARLPGKYRDKWRAGHFDRFIPDGYIETRTTGINTIHDKILSRFYDRLLIITQGDIFSKQRFKEIVYINIGKYFLPEYAEFLERRIKYRYPSRVYQTL